MIAITLACLESHTVYQNFFSLDSLRATPKCLNTHGGHLRISVTYRKLIQKC